MILKDSELEIKKMNVICRYFILKNFYKRDNLNFFFEF